jgi:hypothetical protein
MPERDRQRLDMASNIQRQLAAETTLTPNQARAFVRGLQTAWQVPTIQWRRAESRAQIDDARRLFGAAAIFQKVEGTASANARLCYRRAGEILEWLARAADDLPTFVPLELLAGGAYQLGGLPAMAAALLAKLPKEPNGIELYGRFLRGDFDGVMQTVAAFWQNNLDITDRGASERLLTEEANDKFTWSFTIQLVRVLGAISDALRRGENGRFDKALAKFAALDKLAARILNDDASMLVSLLWQVSVAYRDASIYGPIRTLGTLNPERAPRLEAFARVQYRRRRGILWTSQQHGLSKLIDENSFALCTPTGSGKTLVANLALLKELLLREPGEHAPLALYLVPSRALAGEVEAKLSGELGRDFTITGLYGGADWGVTDYWLTSDNPTVLIATVEKADALMRYLGPVLLRRLRLLIVDEAHQVVPEEDERTLADFAEHTNRAIRLESFVSRLLAQAPGIARIALTAVAGGAASPVARWIEGSDAAQAVGTLYRSTRQIIGTLETSPNSTGTMLLELMNGRPLSVRGRDEAVYLNLRTPPMPQLSATMRSSVFRFNELDVLWTSLHLIQEKRRILISVAQQPERTMGWYKDALELEDWQGAIHFTPPQNEDALRRFSEARAACIDYCGATSFELALLDRGIATNHGQMPQRLRRLMTDLIDQGICPITVATATLTEGVNLPFDIIFVTALKRRSYDTVNNRPEVRPMTTSEFRNLAGRAGRPGASNGMEGITLVPIPRRPSATAPGQIPTQRAQIQGMKDDYASLQRALLAEELQQAEINSPLALLLNGIAERALELLGLSDDSFLTWLETALPAEISEDAGRAATTAGGRLADSVDELDGVLLSALEEVERLRNERLEGAEAEAFLADLWARTFTVYAATQEAWLERAFIRRGRAIIDTIYPDVQERGRLYQYGFTPYVGRRFEGIAPGLTAIISAAEAYGTATRAERLLVFENLAAPLTNDRGYGFRVRTTEVDQQLLQNWRGVLAWWMQAANAVAPEPKSLRAWQRFVTDNLEFRLGVAVGAVVAMAWSGGADNDPLAVLSLATWKETSGLPWFGFWARELLRWGTLDPFVAFALAQGLAQTRDEAAGRRGEFDEWLRANYEAIEPDDLIDPQRFIEWQQSLPRNERATTNTFRFAAQLGGTTGERGVYRVIPVTTGDRIEWIDAAGYRLASSHEEGVQLGRFAYRDDFTLHTRVAEPFVDRTFVG